MEINRYSQSIQSFSDNEIRRAKSAPVKIATPPRLGINVVCILCCPGESYIFHCFRILINTGKNKKEIRNAMAV